MIFNPHAGASRKDRAGLEVIVLAMQSMGCRPEVWVAEPGCGIDEAVREALAEGFRTFAVCGGDGTASCAAGVLAGTDAVMAVIPTGTRNNVAKSIGIPEDAAGAVSLLGSGRRIRIDTGFAECGGRRVPLLEMCAVGLIAAISPPGDKLRHGDISRAGDFLATLVTTEPSAIEIVLDGSLCFRERGHVALVANTPYVGLNYQVCSPGCERDGQLNVLHFADLSKIDLARHIAGGVYDGKPEDPRIQRFLAQTVDINTDPPAPVMVDGSVIGEGPVHIEIMPGSLAVMAPV